MVRWVDPREVREPGKPKSERMKITRSMAIRLFCVECMGYQVGLIKDCPAPNCPLWPFRFGRGQEFTDVPLDDGHKNRYKDKK